MDCEKEIDHEYTDEIVCPYCGHVFSGSWEENSNKEDLGLLECEECDRSFYASRIITVSYSTEKANYGTCKHCKTNDVVIEKYTSTLGKYDGLCLECGVLEKERLVKEYFKKFE